MRRHVRRLVGALSRHAFGARGDLAATEAAIAAALAELGPDGCNDPVLFARVLRDCVGPAEYSAVVTAEHGAMSPPVRVLLDWLGRPPAVPLPAAARLARVADQLTARTEPFSPTGPAADALAGRGWSPDVGLAARVQSSFGRKGRLLTTVVRMRRPTSILELGTAFGMSAAFLAAAAPDARIVSLEPSPLHVAVARELLEAADATNVEVLELTSEAGVEAVRERLSDIELLFHDARHSREAYVEDFDLYEPLLAAGAMVVYDDIDWKPRVGDDPRTYEGWTEVRTRSRVRTAVDVDGLYGIAELR